MCHCLQTLTISYHQCGCSHRYHYCLSYHSWRWRPLSLRYACMWQRRQHLLLMCDLMQSCFNHFAYMVTVKINHLPKTQTSSFRTFNPSQGVKDYNCEFNRGPLHSITSLKPVRMKVINFNETNTLHFQVRRLVASLQGEWFSVSVWNKVQAPQI